MPEALDASFYVYQGVWTNWQKGRVWGATLTLSPRNAAVLVAILALFVHLTGAQLWGILRFAVHQCRVSSRARDGLYHQQQAVLRNSSSDLGAVRQLLRMSWAWRRHTDRPIVRNLSLVSLALFHFVLFGLAGILSSKLVQGGQEVLTRSPFCGTLNESYFESLDPTPSNDPDRRYRGLEFERKAQRDTQLTQQFARSCYNTTTASSSCEVFKLRQLSWRVNLTDDCPFRPPVCRNQPQSINFDSGLLDSRNDLGLNAQDGDRLFYRRATACTPLNDAAYVSAFKNVSGYWDSTVKSVASAFYGPAITNEYNASFSYNNFLDSITSDQLKDISPYQLSVSFAYSGVGLETYSSFTPIKDLTLPDSDTFLFFLTFEKAYEAPVDDPWFSAHRPIHQTSLINSVNRTHYRRELPITTLGCAIQHQLCRGDASSSAAAGHCSPRLGWGQLQFDPRGALGLNMTARQNVTYQRLLDALGSSDLASVIEYLTDHDTPLLAAGLIQETVGAALPNNQWQLEASYWQSLSMAHLQRTLVQHATGQIAADTRYLQLPSTTEERWICANQMVRGTAFESFSVLALALILASGVLVVVLSVVAEDAVGWMQRRSKCGLFRREMWTADETLHLQRLAFEKTGQGTWLEAAIGAVPVTQGREMMASAGLADVEDHVESAETSTSASANPSTHVAVHGPGQGTWLEAAVYAVPVTRGRETMASIGLADVEDHVESARTSMSASANLSADVPVHGPDGVRLARRHSAGTEGTLVSQPT
ncbi:MAG: hypothetical protein M1826_006330 [Phylliscum demangeonii]|nr:MAG: hypothetical protein M1826_006330 [Phylliscum demangeonii]